jgi:hypothetical protein
MIIPKSVKGHCNLTESEIRAYYSLKPLDEDHSDHEKRFNKILTEYLNTKVFKNDNAKYCYKRQLKQMIKDDKITPKYSAFNMWRLKEIEKNISKQKTYLLNNEGKIMPKRPPRDDRNDDLIDENKKLKLEIENLKKQLIEKDEQIDFLMTENTKMKHIPQVTEEKPKPVEIHEIKECLISDTSDEESDDEDEEIIYVDVVDAVENLISNVVILAEALDDSDEEEEEESEEEEEKTLVSKQEAIIIFQKRCIDKITPYHEEFMKLKQGKNDREISKITNDILDKYDQEVIQPEVEKLDDVYDLPNEEYTQVQEKPYDKMKDMILYFSD